MALESRLGNHDVQTTKASIGGRVKDPESKAAIAKEIRAVADNGPTFDVTTGVIKNKKPKKELSPEADAAKQLKGLFNKKLIA